MTGRRRLAARVAGLLLAVVWPVAARAASPEPAVPVAGAPANESDPGGDPATEPAVPTGDDHDTEGHGPRLSDVAIPLQLEGFPQRPRPPVELGNRFLGTGVLHPGFRLPTGAVWQPALLAFGTWRTAVQTFDGGAERTTELRTRLDLFFNLQLSGSERLVVGLRPLDDEGVFTRYAFEGADDGFSGEIDARLDSLFFEGDFGEIFPNLSPRDTAATDFGFAAGRQPLVFQQGLVLGDTIDAVGVTRNTLLPRGTSNVRATFLAGWNDLHRGGVEDDDAQLYALLTSTDVRRSTVDVDVAYVRSSGPLGDQLVTGASAVQRIGLMSSTFRLVGSWGLDDGPRAVGDGVLAMSELSWVPRHTHDHLYLTLFATLDEPTPAARGPGIGGPLAAVGIGFAGSGLGFGGPLSSATRDVAGFALGYQWFSDDERRQVIVELGGRRGLARTVADELAATVRWQRAVGQHHVLLLDGFAGRRQAPGGDQDIVGGRIELLTKF